MHLMSGKSSMVLTQQQDHLLEDESSIKDMVIDMLSSFVLEVVKKYMAAYFSNHVISLPTFVLN
jgi:hypothetical protein